MLNLLLESPFNIRLNSHIKHNKNKNAILALPLLLKNREKFWILKLKTLYPDGLKQELDGFQKLLHCHLLFSAWYTNLHYWQ